MFVVCLLHSLCRRYDLHPGMYVKADASRSFVASAAAAAADGSSSSAVDGANTPPVRFARADGTLTLAHALTLARTHAPTHARTHRTYARTFAHAPHAWFPVRMLQSHIQGSPHFQFRSSLS